MLDTELTRRFGLTVPVVSAPMAGASGGALAGAVSAAGALGMIGIGGSTRPDWIREQGSLAAAAGRPYGLGLLGWSKPDTNGQLDAVLALDPRPALVSVSYGNPPGDERRFRSVLADAGCVVAMQAGTVADALRAVEDGFDLLVARGGEGGGHGRNEVATLPLLDGVLTALDRAGAAVPVLAAGGIGGPRGVAAVLAAGAAGAWVGTAFLACPEALTDDAARARLLRADLTDTVYTGAFDRGFTLGWPEEFRGRALRNRFTDEWAGREGRLATDEDARRRLADARDRRDYDLHHIYAGQSVGLVHRVRPAADVVAELAGAEDLLRRW